MYSVSELVVLSLLDERKILLTLEMTSEKDRIHMQDTNNLEKIQNSQTLPIICCSQSVSEIQQNSTRAREAIPSI